MTFHSNKNSWQVSHFSIQRRWTSTLRKKLRKSFMDHLKLETELNFFLSIISESISVNCHDICNIIFCNVLTVDMLKPNFIMCEMCEHPSIQKTKVQRLEISNFHWISDQPPKSSLCDLWDWSLLLNARHPHQKSEILKIS